MTRHERLALASLLALVPVLGFAQGAPAALHPMQVTVGPFEADGLVRLALGADVVRLAGPGLADLRVVDERGSELPYAVAAAPPDHDADAYGAALVPRDARQQTIAGTPPTFVETYDLDLPTATESPEPEGGFVLDLDVALPRFTASVAIAAIGPRAAPATTHTVFRLRDGVERTRIVVPTGLGRTIRVELRGEDGFLSPSFRIVTSIPAGTTSTLEVPLGVDGPRTEGGRTTIELTAPNALIPSALRVESSTPTFVREARVLGRVGDAWVELGEGTIARAPSPTATDARSLALAPIRTERLRLVLVDGASPPLADLRVVALVAQPTLVFDTQGAKARGGTLRVVFGGSRGVAPHYPERDLFERAPSAELPGVTHGAIEPNPDHRPAPALGFAMRAGAAVDVRAFRLRASLDVPVAPEGVVRVGLPWSIVAASRPGLSDLRIVDAQDRQWPYVQVVAETTTPLAVRARREPGAARRSVLRVTLPGGGIVVTSLFVDPGVTLVDRPITIESVERPEEPILLVRTRLLRRPGQTGPIEIPLASANATHLRVTIEDGDDAPLSPRFSIAFRRPVLYVTAPAGRYRVLVGAFQGPNAVESPVYELETARALVLAVPSTEGRLGRLEPNPASEPPTAFSQDRFRDVALWSVLVIATIALVGLTLRLSRVVVNTPSGD